MALNGVIVRSNPSISMKSTKDIETQCTLASVNQRKQLTFNYNKV